MKINPRIKSNNSKITRTNKSVSCRGGLIRAPSQIKYISVELWTKLFFIEGSS